MTSFYNRSNYGFNRNTTTKENSTEHCAQLNSASTDTVTQLEFSREGEPLLAASSWDQTIRIWKFDDWSYQNPTYLCGYKEPANAILRFCFNEDCTRIYFGTTAGEIKDYFFSNKQGSTFTSFKTFGTTSTTAQKTAFGSTPGAAQKTAFGSTPGAAQKTFGSNSGTATKPSFGFNSGGTFGKTSTGFGAKGYTPAKIPLLIPANYSSNTQTTSLPPSEYLVSGLKWHTTYKLVVALTTNSTAERDYPHSFLGYVDPNKPEVSAYAEIYSYKIINMDLNDDVAWIISINAQDGTPCILSAKLDQLKQTITKINPFIPFPSEIQSMPTSIAAYPSGQTGYIAATIQGFIEIKSNISNERNRADLNFYEGTFRTENEKCCETYSANCVAVCPFDKKIALVCSRNEVALFNLEKGIYRKFIPSTGKVSAKDPITACAFSPSGEMYALAYGYDWSRGADELKRNKPNNMILVGNTPEAPKAEE